MNNDNKSCVNIIKCIGTISEINIEFYPNGNVHTTIILSINGDSVRFNQFINKKYNNEQYYQLLETIGIPYKFISCIDNDEYELSDGIKPIELSMIGSVKIMNGKNNVRSQVDFNRTSRPTKLFVISTLNEYGLNMTYMSRTSKQSYISPNIQGVIYRIENDYATVVINQDIIVEFRCDESVVDKIVYNEICNFKLTWDNGYDIIDDVISNVKQSGFRLIDIKSTGIGYDKGTMDTLVKIYDIKREKL